MESVLLGHTTNLTEVSMSPRHVLLTTQSEISTNEVTPQGPFPSPKGRWGHLPRRPLSSTIGWLNDLTWNDFFHLWLPCLLCKILDLYEAHHYSLEDAEQFTNHSVKSNRTLKYTQLIFFLNCIEEVVSVAFLWNNKVCGSSKGNRGKVSSKGAR